MFPEGALDEMGITSAEMGQRCTPIMDILSDGQIISCYPLADHHTETIPENEDPRLAVSAVSRRPTPVAAVDAVSEMLRVQLVPERRLHRRRAYARR